MSRGWIPDVEKVSTNAILVCYTAHRVSRPASRVARDDAHSALYRPRPREEIIILTLSGTPFDPFHQPWATQGHGEDLKCRGGHAHPWRGSQGS